MREILGFDTFLAAHAIDENRGLSLLDQCSVALGVNNWGKGVQSFGLAEVENLRDLLDSAKVKNLKERLTPLWGEEGMGYYCARDTAYCHELYQVQRQRLREDPEGTTLLKKLVFPGVNAFVEIETNGIYVDVPRLRERDLVLEARWTALRAELVENHIDPEFYEERQAKSIKNKNTKDLFSNDNFIRDWVYGEEPRGLGMIPFAFTKTGLAKVDDDTLKLLDHPSLRMFKELKSTANSRKFFSQWLEWLGDDGRIHASFNLGGTVTGRRSNANPNIQQTPRDKFVRSVLGAAPGYLFLELDYSQVEVRLAAWLANETHMLEIFANNGDIYRTTAAGILGKKPEEISGEERQKAKAYVLGFLYGMGARGFVEYARDTYELEFSLDEATEIRNAYFTLFPALVRWHEDAKRHVMKFLKIQSPAGRTRHLVNILSMKQFERGKAGRQAINSPVQGLGGDFLLSTVIELMKRFEDKSDMVRIVGDVHDALLLEVREDTWKEVAAEILTIMEEPPIMKELCIDWPMRLIAEGRIGKHWKIGPEFNIDDLGDSEKTASIEEQLALSLMEDV